MTLYVEYSYYHKWPESLHKTLLLYDITFSLKCLQRLTKSSDTHPVMRGPVAAPECTNIREVMLVVSTAQKELAT